MKQPTCLPAYKQLGHIYYQQQHFDKAIPCYQQVLNMPAATADDYNNLAACLIATKHYNDALALLADALALDSTHQTARMNMAACFLEIAGFDQAIYHYTHCLSNDPHNPDIHYNLGSAYMAQGRFEEAILQYEKLITQDPTAIDSKNNLAVCLFQLNRHQEAIALYQQIITQDPNHPLATHMLNALLGNKKATYSPDYIRTLFDGYAAYFDNHANAGLAYQVPNTLKTFISNTRDTKKPTSLLDLGCGTGLSGECFAQDGTYLVGIDLSEKMLRHAQQKNCYDALICADIYQLPCRDSFDWIIAADLFVYCADLEPLFTAIYRIINKEGLFAFTIENNPQENYQLLTSGRFAHHRDYIHHTASTAGFHYLTDQVAPLRKHQGNWLEGTYYLFQA